LNNLAVISSAARASEPEQLRLLKACHRSPRQRDQLHDKGALTIDGKKLNIPPSGYFIMQLQSKRSLAQHIGLGYSI